MITVESATELRALLKRYIDAQAKSTAAQDARARLGPGSTRARVTTANANWASAAEHRDRAAAEVENKLRALVLPVAVATVAEQDDFEWLGSGLRFRTSAGRTVVGMDGIRDAFAKGESLMFPDGAVARPDPGNPPLGFTVERP